MIAWRTSRAHVLSTSTGRYLRASDCSRAKGSQKKSSDARGAAAGLGRLDRMCFYFLSFAFKIVRVVIGWARSATHKATSTLTSSAQTSEFSAGARRAEKRRGLVGRVAFSRCTVSKDTRFCAPGVARPFRTTAQRRATSSSEEPAIVEPRACWRDTPTRGRTTFGVRVRACAP